MQSDFRVTFINNICYVYDSCINQIQTMKLENFGLKLEVKYDHICNYRFTNNNLIEEGNYKKVFEKKWSLYNIEKEGKELIRWEKKVPLSQDFKSYFE